MEVELGSMSEWGGRRTDKLSERRNKREDTNLGGRGTKGKILCRLKDDQQQKKKKKVKITFVGQTG